MLLRGQSRNRAVADDQLDAGDVLMVTRLDRLARSTRDPEAGGDSPARPRRRASARDCPQLQRGHTFTPATPAPARARERSLSNGGKSAL
jgi:hypothetical protein